MHSEDRHAFDESLEAAQRRIRAREQAIDPQLPDASFAAATDPVLLVRREGRVGAVGAVQLTSLAPDHPDALWGACQRSELQLSWDGNVSAVSELLDLWIAEAAPKLGSANNWETSLELHVASRDSELVLPLLQRGFTQVGITGIRVGHRGPSEQAALDHLAAAGITLRLAEQGDAPMLGIMDSELLQHDAQHGGVEFRDGAAASLQRGIEERLGLDPEWTWVIEKHGEAVGYLSLETGRERHREKIAPGGPVAYVQAMYLRPTARGGGIGEAVMHFAHARAAQAGYDRILLGYAALNPRSGPFWCRMGYRPIWSSWQRRPATTIMAATTAS